jgi:hypothetical protein
MNRECIQPGGAGIYPLIGDVTSSAGNNRVAVTGLQSIPLSSTTPLPGSGIEYNANNSQWEPTLIATIQVNGLTLSDDGLVSVNVVKPILVNGS